MLASHALVLLGVPLNRVIKRIRMFREERYKMFKGYFRGVSDDRATDAHQIRLHSIEINKNAYCKNLRLDQINFGLFNVELQLIRRPNMLEDISPRGDIVLGDGDVLVLLGNQQNLIDAENYLVSGQTT